TEIANLVHRCTSAHEGASRMIQLLYGLGVDSLPWFLSFESNLKSRLFAPGFSVESKVGNGLVALDSDLAVARDEQLRRAAEGWARLLGTRPVRAGLTKCVADQSPASAP